jgi:hypothetical protein
MHRNEPSILDSSTLPGTYPHNAQLDYCGAVHRLWEESLPMQISKAAPCASFSFTTHKRRSSSMFSQ